MSSKEQVIVRNSNDIFFVIFEMKPKIYERNHYNMLKLA